MRITDVVWRGFRIPFRQPVVGGPGTVRYGLLVQVLTDKGWTGTGEASPPGVGDEEAVEQLARLISWAGSTLVGLRIEEAFGTLSILCVDHPFSGPARFGLETALYDLLGREQGQPLTTLLGGSARPVRVNALLPGGDPLEVARSARSAVAQGFTTLKMKVGRRRPEEEERLLEAVRHGAGPDVALRVDANGAWTPESAVTAIRRLERFDLEYVEQPVPAGEVTAFLLVRRGVSVPLAADESVRSPQDARHLVETDAVSVVVVKAARMGLTEAVKVVRLVMEAGRRVVVTSSLESGVGLAASLHLAGLLPPGGPACGLATGPLLESDLLQRPLVPSGGSMVVPPGPGLGVAVDAEALRHYAFGPSGAVRL